MAKNKGKFVVLDGGEGSGKTTVAKEIVKQFGWGAVYTHEPGGSPYAEKIRDLVLSDEAKSSDAETQFALFWAARRDHLKHVVAPALVDGKIVICDRFDSSTYAYQIVAQGNIQLLDLFWKMREHFLKGFEPDKYILLDVAPEVGLARVKSRGGVMTHFDKRKLDFHKKVNKGLKEFITTQVKKGEVVDAEQPLERVIEDVSKIVSKLAG